MYICFQQTAEVDKYINKDLVTASEGHQHAAVTHRESDTHDTRVNNLLLQN